MVFDLCKRLKSWFGSYKKCVTSAGDLFLGDGYTNLLNDSGRNQRSASGHFTTDEPSAALLCDNDSASLVLPLQSENGIERPSGLLVNTSQQEVTVSKQVCSQTKLPQFLSKMILCFSPYTNAIKLFAIPSVKSDIPNLNCLNAIRVFSICWVILGHAFLFLMTIYDNVWTFFEKPKDFAFQFIMEGIFAVDTFFFLSGFLAYWSLSRQFHLLGQKNSDEDDDCENGNRKRNRFWFWQTLPFVYFHRFIRIVPPYAAVIVIDLCLWRYLGTGPFYFQGTDDLCQRNWWTNLLFINNLIPMVEQCVGWGWYLAVDMQLFVFAPFLVVLFTWKPKWAWLVSFILLLGQAATCIGLTFYYDLPATLFAPSQSGNQSISM